MCGVNLVGIATRHGDERSGDRIPVGARLSAPIQAGFGTHPAFCIIGTGCFPRRGVNHLPPSSADVEERVWVYMYSPTGPSGLLFGDRLAVDGLTVTHGEVHSHIVATYRWQSDVNKNMRFSYCKNSYIYIYSTYPICHWVTHSIYWLTSFLLRIPYVRMEKQAITCDGVMFYE